MYLMNGTTYSSLRRDKRHVIYHFENYWISDVLWFDEEDFKKDKTKKKIYYFMSSRSSYSAFVRAGYTQEYIAQKINEGTIILGASFQTAARYQHIQDSQDHIQDQSRSC